MQFQKYLFILFLFIGLTAQAQDITVSTGAYAWQSTTSSGGVADRAVDGNTSGQWGDGSVTHTAGELSPYWSCDIGYSADVKRIKVWNRLDCCVERLSNFYVFASAVPFTSDLVEDLNADPNVMSQFIESFPFPSITIPFTTSAQYFRVQLLNEEEIPLSIAEFEVIAEDNGKINQTITFPAIDRKKTTDESFVLEASSTAGLDITYAIVSGPASVDGNMVSLSGEAGMVTVRATQGGDDMTNPAPPREQTFEILDPADSDVYANIVSLTESYQLIMPELNPYQLKASASIDNDDLFEIENAYFEINGFVQETTMQKGLYTCWWRPHDYGNHDIRFVATGSNGKIVSEEITTEVFQFGATETITTFDKALISFPNASRTFQDTYHLPTHVGSYNHINAILSITCPAGGCDPWDRVAWIQARHPGGEWTEIIRYITPFGVQCSHTIDLTEYMSVLSGEVELRFFIDTWAQGWEATLRLTYSSGIPEYLYSNVDVVWNQAYDFGNYANLQPVDTIDYQFHDDVEAAEMRILISGHGWGDNNYENAAEFRYTQNNLIIGETDHWHDVWNICNPNPDFCQPQNGTWQFNRSGWCPGAVTRPITFDMNEYLTESNVDLHYQMDPFYVDRCHPNHPDCVSGVTCVNCNAGFNPHYHIRGNLVSYSNQPIGMGAPSGVQEKTEDVKLFMMPNPASEYVDVQWGAVDVQSVNLFDSNGKLVDTAIPVNGASNVIFDVRTLAGGIYYVELVETTNDITTKQLVVLK